MPDPETKNGAAAPPPSPPDLETLALTRRETLEAVATWLLDLDYLAPEIDTWNVRRGHGRPPEGGPRFVSPQRWSDDRLIAFLREFAAGGFLREFAALHAEQTRLHGRIVTLFDWLDRVNAPELRVLADLLRRHG